jgi:hypothetical protein
MCVRVVSVCVVLCQSKKKLFRDIVSLILMDGPLDFRLAI